MSQRIKKNNVSPGISKVPAFGEDNIEILVRKGIFPFGKKRKKLPDETSKNMNRM